MATYATLFQVIIMDQYKNLAFSLFPDHDTSTPMFPNDDQSQCHDDDFHQLPGITRITRPHSSTLSRQAETSLLLQLERQTKTKGCASRMPVTIPFLVHHQSDGSEPSPHPPSCPSSVSPPSSEPCSFREPFPSKSQIFVKLCLNAQRKTKELHIPAFRLQRRILEVLPCPEVNPPSTLRLGLKSNHP
jgi:hypothetical protein